MEFAKDVSVPEHSHEAQWGIILEGKIDLVIDGKLNTYSKGDRYFIPEGVKHSAMIYHVIVTLHFLIKKIDICQNLEKILIKFLINIFIRMFKYYICVLPIYGGFIMLYYNLKIRGCYS
ncbi:hypothetical protein LCGC14_1954490 [marine sediment metagenome]|uniref:Cupin type-2 domain-containing protein n=1 Tax=marine sediment metagenome TaxID=412755 RepID=A0A0F9IDK6_9ZZZZ